ncbi:MAG: LysR family transcriptional regulator [Rhodobacteraceae bacterium]|nr:LysR family transcriptional regulator [Paracoccaceae bacterium]
MYLEFRHLRTIRAIHQQGGLGRAAEVLNITQSALSHQVKGLEEQVGMELFLRRSKPLKLSKAGHKLLALADKVLPQVELLEQDFANLIGGTAGRMHIAIECHACFEWLFPVLETFRKDWAHIDVDIRPGLAFDALPALQREEVDLVISGDPIDLEGIEFIPLFEYAPTFLAGANHPLAAKPFIEPADLKNELLITYPVDKSKVDAYTTFLAPAGVEPRALRQVELTAVIMLLVASGRGVTVLPDWVIAEEKYGHDFIARPLGKDGMVKRMYAAIRSSEADAQFMRDFVQITRDRQAGGENPLGIAPSTA